MNAKTTAKKDSARPPKKPPGPVPETVRIEGKSWEDAIKTALSKKRPAGGWPEQKKKPTK